MNVTVIDKDTRIRIKDSNLCGSIIGSNDGTIGVFLDTGEYIDIAEELIQRIQI